MTSRLIGVTGYKNSGKNAVCNVLRDEFGFVITGFADVLKSMMLAIDPIVNPGSVFPLRVSEVVEQYGWDDVKETYPEARRLLQKLGTEGGREHLGENVWVDAWQRVAGYFLEAGQDVCVSDMRFLNEARAVRDLGGSIVRVRRPGTQAGDHLSESELDQIEADYKIYNYRDLDQLAMNVRILVAL